MNGFVTNIQRFSTHDGPGIRTTIFLQGCPLTCIWCQNPEAMTCFQQVIFERSQCVQCFACRDRCEKKCFEFNTSLFFNSENCNQCGECISVCRTGALRWSSYEYSVKEILDRILRDKLYFDLSNGGVTISGGEPLYQFNFCYDLIKKLKQNKLHVAIDTSGYVLKKRLKKIIPHVDLFLYDYKIFDKISHKKYTGKSNSMIHDNLVMLSKTGKEIIVRMPLVPNITDNEKNISQIKKDVESISDKLQIEFIPFNRLCKSKYEMVGKNCPVV